MTELSNSLTIQVGHHKVHQYCSVQSTVITCGVTKMNKGNIFGSELYAPNKKAEKIIKQHK